MRCFLYNVSRIIQDGGQVHYRARTVLEFPANIPLILLFHGNLIHSGVESKYRDNEFSMAYSPDIRAFAYINNTGIKPTSREGIPTRSAYSSVNSCQVTHEDSITTTTTL